MAKALYICYFGLRQPLVQTQVLPYLRELRKDGHQIVLLTFEPEFSRNWTREAMDDERKRLVRDGIEWFCLPYHKRLSAIATVYDVFRGAVKVRKLIRKRNIDILHGRIHVPALMAALARKFSRRKPKLLFDIRGFFPEEYTDAGIWPENGTIYRSVKRVERWLMKESDAFVVLTEKAKNILFPECSGTPDSDTDQFGRPVAVIPCCVDLNGRFFAGRATLRAKARAELGIGDRQVFVHAGALGGLYLTEQIADLLAAARQLDAGTFAMFLTQSDPGSIVPLLRERGFKETDYFVSRVAPGAVPGYLCAADAGISFVKAGYATQSRSPTKIPEYLACGLPIIANPGVGDVDELIKKNSVGVLVESFSEAGYTKALDQLDALGNIGGRCRAAAEANFDLETIGGTRYRLLYSKLAEIR